MAASTKFVFGNARDVFCKKLNSWQDSYDWKEIFQSVAGNDSEKKLAVDQALRDVIKDAVEKTDDCEVYKEVIEHSIELANEDVCSVIMPFVLLSDVFDLIPLSQCEIVFYLVEDKLSVWKLSLFYDAGKNYLLRMCNDLLRRLSKSQNTVFCGRIQLFLSRLFPLSEKSALNLMSQFNLENVTVYSTKSDEIKLKPREVSYDVMEVEEGEMEDLTGSTPIDYNLYRRFWALQEYFRKPSQCYEKVPWKGFQQNADVVLNAFASAKLDDLKSSRRKLDLPRPADTKAFFAKYLTSEKLLDLQLNDSNFRRYVLVQFLIVFQYLNSQVKFKSASQTLTDEQSTWVKTTQDKVYQLIKETPPDGEQFCKTVQHILGREEHWNKWKNEGCPNFARNMEEETKFKSRAKRRFVGDDLQAHGGKIIKMGSAELTRLWNINPDNLEACKAEKRIFLPSLEEFFADAMEQANPENQFEEQYKVVNNAVFQWKSLRLLARRSPHFFGLNNTPAMPLPQYLEVMLNKIAQELPSMGANGEVSQETGQEEMRTELGEDEAIKEAQEVEEEEELKRQNEEQGVPEDILSKDQIDLLAEKLGEDWKRLGMELNFPEEDMAYFESENSEKVACAKKMLTIWQENEGERATTGTLKIALKEVGLPEVVEAVFGST
ncbi:THO complex subunit 1-like [Saccostrea cucullata]|uniref:THO complex subunit 1-like n=1 Tax=Saccostrea cuccullata TaxID=36930 RepID=UPI002ED1443B